MRTKGRCGWGCSSLLTSGTWTHGLPSPLRGSASPLAKPKVQFTLTANHSLHVQLHRPADRTAAERGPDEVHGPALGVHTQHGTHVFATEHWTDKLRTRGRSTAGFLRATVVRVLVRHALH